jgi:hypothetical protein
VKRFFLFLAVAVGAAASAVEPQCPLPSLTDSQAAVFTSPRFRAIPVHALAEGRNTLLNHLPIILEKGGADVLKAAGIEDIFEYDDDLDAVVRSEQTRLQQLDPETFLRRYVDPAALEQYVQSPDISPAALAGLSGVSPSGKKALVPNAHYLELGKSLAEQLVARLRAEGKLPHPPGHR